MLVLFYYVMISIVFTDFNPFSVSPLAGFKSYYFLVNLLTKIVVSIWLLLPAALQKSLSIEYSLIYTILMLLLLLVEYKLPPALNSHISTQHKIQYTFLFINGLYVVVINLYKTQNMNPDIALIYFPMIFLSSIACILYLEKEVLLRLTEINLDMETTRFTLGVYSLVTVYEKHDEYKSLIVTRIRSLRHLNEICSKRHQEDNSLQDEKMLFYTFLDNAITYYISNKAKDEYLILISGYINEMRLSYLWKGIHSLQEIYHGSYSFAAKVNVNYYIRIIERQIQESDGKMKDGVQIDVQGLMEYQTNSGLFNQLIVKCYEYYYSFWSQLAHDEPNLLQIKQLGEKILKTNAELKTSYDNMVNSMAQQPRVMTMYGNFLKLVVNDPEEAEKMLGKVSTMKSRGNIGLTDMESRKIKYSDISNTSMIIASGDGKRVGKIKSFNAETARLFGYLPEEISGSKINMLMPRIFADHHDAWMMRYFKTNQSTVMNNERRIFPRNKKGYLLVSQLYIKVASDIRDEISIVGIMSVDTTSNDIVFLVDGHTGMLLGVTEKCGELFGITGQHCYSSEFASSQLNILQLIPEVTNVQQLLTKEGQRVKLDLSIMQLDYANHKEQGNHKTVTDLRLLYAKQYHIADESLKILELHLQVAELHNRLNTFKVARNTAAAFESATHDRTIEKMNPIGKQEESEDASSQSVKDMILEIVAGEKQDTNSLTKSHQFASFNQMALLSNIKSSKHLSKLNLIGSSGGGGDKERKIRKSSNGSASDLDKTKKKNLNKYAMGSDEDDEELQKLERERRYRELGANRRKTEIRTVDIITNEIMGIAVMILVVIAAAIIHIISKNLMYNFTNIITSLRNLTLKQQAFLHVAQLNSLLSISNS